VHLLYVTAAMPFSFGETFITTEILELRRRGHRVTVVPVRPRRRDVPHDDARQLTDSTINEAVLSLRVVLGALGQLIHAPLESAKAAWLIARSRSLKVLFNNLAVLPKGLWLGGVAREKQIHHIHAHWLGTSATTAFIASIVSGVDWSFTAHRWDISENNLIEEKTRTAKFARAIDISGGREPAALMGPYSHKLRIIHMGVAINPPGLGPAPMGKTSLRVLLGAHFFEKKGHVFALRAISILKASGVDVWLDCAGDGPLRNIVEQWAVSLGVADRVRFMGLVSHPQLLSRLRLGEWNVALLSSVVTPNAHEGIPVILMEAMAAGLPVVATETGGVPELLAHGVGLLVPERDPEAIAAALAQLASDVNLRGSLSRMGLERIRDEFEIESVVSALLNQIS
jgi:colanic acid/amylovoran biosynthesis glycosyltransferase